MEKIAPVDFEINPLLQRRWSPRAFLDKTMTETQMAQLLEAARWAPSCYNDQPWFYVVALRQDEAAFKKLLACLVGPNQTWAQAASALLIAFARTHFSTRPKPNRHASHDLGIANALLTVQAESMGLAVHQMAGILVDKIRETLSVPEGVEPLVGLAVGYGGSPEQLPEGFAEKERAPRTRKPQSEFVFRGDWGSAFEPTKS